MQQRIIGLTGGMGTGKSTVAQILAQYGIPVWDADLASREIVAPGTPVYQAIVERYGTDIINTTGELQRAKLGALVFAQPTELTWLEQQIHPVVRQQAQRWLRVRDAPILVLVIPLLFEAAMTDLITEIWVVSCTSASQYQRIQARDQLSPEAITQRLARQWSLAQKIALADVVIDNNGSLEDLTKQLQQLISPDPKEPELT